jgi:hypothetical protein
LRRGVARAERFREGWDGYALGEDRDFCYRVAGRRALFLCPTLRIVHRQADAGRPDPRRLGRTYVHHSVQIAAGAGGGVGTYLLLGLEIAGMFALHAAWLGMGDRRSHWGFLRGMSAGLADGARHGLRRAMLQRPWKQRHDK